jgi:PAS domain S-box-containing protein
MEAGSKAVKCLIISNSQTFFKGISRNLSSQRHSFDIRSSNNPGNIKNLIFYQDLAIIEDDYIHQTAESVLVDLISFLHASQIKVILFVDFKKKLPAFVSKRSDFIRFVSKSASINEFRFVLEELLQQLKTAATGRKIGHEKYLEAIIQIQNTLLNKLPIDAKMEEVLRIVGRTSNATHVAIFENGYDKKGKFLMKLRSEWTHEKYVFEDDNPLFKVMPYHPNFSRWLSTLSAGRIINGYVHKFPVNEQSLLKTIGIRNLLLIPVLIKSEFWGFVLIGVNRAQNLWEKEELPYLKSIISPVASFVELKKEENRQVSKGDQIEHYFRESNIGFFIANREGKVSSCNMAFSRFIGYDEKSLQNLSLKAISHPEDFSAEIHELKQLLTGKTDSYFLDKRFLNRDRKPVWAKVNVFAHQKEGSKPEFMIGIVEDIQGQKVAEQALKESKERYERLSELAKEGIILHQDEIVIDFNQRILDLFGYTREELIGSSIFGLLNESSSGEILRAKLHGKGSQSVVAIGCTKSGQKIPLELESRKIEYRGRSIQMTAFRDITVKKSDEHEIRKLNTAIDQSPSSIVITDQQGKIEFVNRSFCDISGYSHEEAIGENPRILKTEYHPKAFYENLWSTITRGERWQGVFKNKSKDGNYFWERSIISPIFDEKKNITHYLAIKENITQEKQAREALEKSEERHRIIAELTNDFVYSAVIEQNNITIDWKSGYLENLAGFEVHEVNEKAIGWYSIIHEDDLKRVVFPAILNLPRKKTLSIEYRINTKDNKEKWVSDKLRLISEGMNGDKLAVIGALQDITPRKSATVALDQSKRYLDSIIDNLPIGLQIFDENGFTQRVNEAKLKQLDTEDDELLGIFNILTDPDSQNSGADKLYREVYEDKITINHEFEIELEKYAEGERRKITINEIIFPILKSDGSVHSVISLTNDITKRVEAEKALKASERYQKALLKVIPDLIFVFDEDGIFRDVYVEESDKVLIPSGDFSGKSFSDVFPQDLSDIFYEKLHEAMRSGEKQSFEYEIELQDRRVNYEIRLIVSKENEVIAIIRDISENVEAQRSLKASEEKFRELAERTQDTLILLSASNEVLYVSPNLERILGISREKYIKNPVQALRLIHADDRHAVIPAMNEFRKKKLESIDLQFRVMLVDDQVRWLWYRENAIFNENHQPVRYATVITDITASKRAEEQLMEAKEEAEKAYRSKSVFLANMSHEIRTPMNAVLGFTDLLYSRISDPVLKGYLNSIKSSGNTLLNLLNDILDLSKIEAEKMRIVKSPVNLFRVFEEVKHIFSLKALEKGLDYSFRIDKDIPQSLLMDELRLKQILLNLIDNAIKFTEKGEIKVKAKVNESNNDNNNVDVVVTVEDTGIGIPEHMQESIFESFRQQDDQDKKKFKGTGLGLAITKRLVELSNGEMRLSSKPGKGSKFKVVLPDLEIADPILTTEISSNRKIQLKKSTLKDKVILLIDEQKTNRDLIKEVFHHSESKVIEGERVEDVLDRINVKVDLVLIEMKNPGSVLEDLILLNNHPELQNTTKIGFTSTADFSLEPKVLAAFKTILTKPIKLDEFVELVDNHFKNIDIEQKSNGTIFRENYVDFHVLNEVIKLLKGDMYKQWESATSTSSFAEIEQFAQDVREIGTEYNLHALNTFSDVLTMHVKNFDIDRMNEVLKTYPAIIKELKGNLKKLTSDN